MSTLGALTAAWTAVEAALPRGWHTVGVVRREQALRLLPVVSDLPRPDWCALAADEAGILYDGWGEYHAQALMVLAVKLRDLRGSTAGS
jgi:hypothetical protein